MPESTKSSVERTTVEFGKQAYVLRFSGDITSASKAAVVGAYSGLPKDEAKQILLDFSRVEYMNSSGIALIIQILMEAHTAGQTIECFGLTPHFQKVFTMLGLTKFTRLHADEDAARKALAD